MKVIDHNFKLPCNAVILELQIYCKKLILNPSCSGVIDLFDLNKKVQQHTSLIGLNYEGSDLEDIFYEVRSNLTHDIFTVRRHGETFVTIISRKKEFEFAFKDFDASRFN